MRIRFEQGRITGSSPDAPPVWVATPERGRPLQASTCAKTVFLCSLGDFALWYPRQPRDGAALTLSEAQSWGALLWGAHLATQVKEDPA